MNNPTRSRGFASVVVLALAATSLAACSGGEDEPSGGGSTGDSGGTSISWLSARAESDTTIQAVKAIAEEYQLDHPDFELNIEHVADRPSYLQKVKILATSGELPDWFDADPEPYFADIVNTGILADVGDIYDELGVRDSFYPISIDYPTMEDGSLNLITWNANAEYFFYNKDVFDAAGLTPPETLAEVVAACDAIADTGKVGISVAGANRWPYYRYLAMPAFRATGNEFLMDLAKGEASMLDEVGLESSTFLQDIGTHCFQEGASTTDETTALNLMLNGEAGMYYTGTWDIGSFLDDSGELLPNIGMFTMPPTGGDDATAPTDYFVNSGIGTAIRADALDDGMKEFLKFLFESFPNVLLYDFDTLPSIEPEIRDDLPTIYSDILSDIAGVTEYARVWDVVLDANTVDTLARESESLALGLTTPEAFGAAVDAALATYNSTN